MYPALNNSRHVYSIKFQNNKNVSAIITTLMDRRDMDSIWSQAWIALFYILCELCISFHFNEPSMHHSTWAINRFHCMSNRWALLIYQTTFLHMTYDSEEWTHFDVVIVADSVTSIDCIINYLNHMLFNSKSCSAIGRKTNRIRVLMIHVRLMKRHFLAKNWMLEKLVCPNIVLVHQLIYVHGNMKSTTKTAREFCLL